MSCAPERLAAYVARIREAFPRLDVRVAQSLGAGDNNDALLVNGTLVFRFPRHAPALAELARETAVLTALAGHLPLAIPQPIYVAGDFAGYERIPGERLESATLRALPSADQQAIAEQLGEFLRALHRIPAEDLPAIAQTPQDTPRDWNVLLARFQRWLFAHMRPEARAAGGERGAAKARGGARVWVAPGPPPPPLGPGH
ncbi:MAG: phosphotransferase family protein, partial [Ktedonobacterales bacterium]